MPEEPKTDFDLEPARELRVLRMSPEAYMGLSEPDQERVDQFLAIFDLTPIEVIGVAIEIVAPAGEGH